MDIIDAIKTRRSIRKYKDIPVPAETLIQVLDAGRLAPSWHNQQCWRFVVISESAAKEALLGAVVDDNPGKKGLVQAPVAIVVCGCPSESGVRDGKPYYMADTALAFHNLCLAAWGFGLGTCWIGALDEAAIKQTLKIPEEIRIVGVTPLGYPDQEPRQRPRKELSEVAFNGEWGVPLNSEFPVEAGV